MHFEIHDLTEGDTCGIYEDDTSAGAILQAINHTSRRETHDLHAEEVPPPKWHITKEYVTELESRVGWEGPRGCGDDKPDESWTKFRMYTDDKDLLYEGVMNKSCEGWEPLEHLGKPDSGCTLIEMFVNGKWIWW